MICGASCGDHALAALLARALERSLNSTVYVCPGNGGSFAHGDGVASLPLKAADVDGLASFALLNRVGLILVTDPVALERGLSQLPY